MVVFWAYLRGLNLDESVRQWILKCLYALLMDSFPREVAPLCGDTPEVPA